MIEYCLIIDFGDEDESRYSNGGTYFQGHNDL